MEILNNEYLQLVIWLFVLSYGIAFGIKNWSIWVFSLFSDGHYVQNDIGKTLDALWIVCVIFLIWVLQ